MFGVCTMRTIICTRVAVMLIAAMMLCAMTETDATNTTNPNATTTTTTTTTGSSSSSSTPSSYNFAYQITPHGIEIKDSPIVVLDTDNFDSYVFPGTAAESATVPSDGTSSNNSTNNAGAMHERESWFIFVYAPWCGHCKHAAPHFINASRMLNTLRRPHARMGILNSQGNNALMKRLGVHSFPTLLYTTGQGRRWYEYHSSRSITYLIRFAPYLHELAAAKSSVINVSDAARFEQFMEETVADEATGHKRVGLFYVFVPHSGASVNMTPETQRLTEWCAILDTLAGMSNVRVGAIYERFIPDANKEDEDSINDSNKSRALSNTPPAPHTGTAGFSWQDVVRAGRECVAHNFTQSSDGVVLLATSDRLAHPTCYRGLWTARSSPSGAPTSDDGDEEEVEAGGHRGNLFPEQTSSDTVEFRAHVNLMEFVYHNQMPAISKLYLNQLHLLNDASVPFYLAILIVNGTLDSATDTSYLPAMRRIIQAINHKQASRSVAGPAPVLHASSLSSYAQPSITWAYVDDTIDPAVLGYLKLDKDRRALPTVVMIDVTYSHIYLLPTQLPRFEQVKHLPEAWEEGGEVAELIEIFAENVLMKRYWSEKSSWAGRIAEALTMIPGLGRLHRLMDREDTMFVCLVLGLAVAVAFLAMAIVVEMSFGSRGGSVGKTTSERVKKNE